MNSAREGAVDHRCAVRLNLPPVSGHSNAVRAAIEDGQPAVADRDASHVGSGSTVLDEERASRKNRDGSGADEAEGLGRAIVDSKRRVAPAEAWILLELGEDRTLRDPDIRRIEEQTAGERTRCVRHDVAGGVGVHLNVVAGVQSQCNRWRRRWSS